jgi:hypothetical protein
MNALGAATILCGNNPRTCLLASVINSKDALDLRSQTPTEDANFAIAMSALRAFVRTLVRASGQMLDVRVAVAPMESKITQAGSMRRRCRRVPALRSSFAGFRFPGDVIVIALRWYLRYT